MLCSSSLLALPPGTIAPTMSSHLNMYFALFILRTAATFASCFFMVRNLWTLCTKCVCVALLCATEHSPNPPNSSENFIFVLYHSVSFFIYLWFQPFEALVSLSCLFARSLAAHLIDSIRSSFGFDDWETQLHSHPKSSSLATRYPLLFHSQHISSRFIKVVA